MNELELSEQIKQAYDEYYLWKAHNNPGGGYAYDTEVTKLIEWLKNKPHNYQPGGTWAPETAPKDIK